MFNHRQPPSTSTHVSASCFRNVSLGLTRGERSPTNQSAASSRHQQIKRKIASAKSVAAMMMMMTMMRSISFCYCSLLLFWSHPARSFQTHQRVSTTIPGRRKVLVSKKEGRRQDNINFNSCCRRGIVELSATTRTTSNNNNNNQNNNNQKKDELFWSQQQALADEMQRSAVQSLRQEQRERFKQKRLALVNDTAYISALIFATCWLLSSDPYTAASYVPGAILGLFYSYGLGKSVEKIGVSSLDSLDNDQKELEEAGSGFGDARLAFLLLLFVLIGKFQAQGLQPFPAIAGFFTYQLASLKQGLQQDLD
jgi:hypothetical protein